MKIPLKTIYFRQKNFTLLKGDSFELLSHLDPKSINFIFADPPYFLSSGGISVQSGKMVSVNKGDWDLSKTIEEKLRKQTLEVDYLAPFLAEFGLVDSKSISQQISIELKERCLADLKQHLIDKANLIQKRFEGVN